MKLLTIPLLCVAVSSCAIVHDTRQSLPGYTYYDPCTRCGESWQRMPNQNLNAVKRANSSEWRSDSARRRSLERMYGADWAERFPELAARYGAKQP